MPESHAGVNEIPESHAGVANGHRHDVPPNLSSFSPPIVPPIEQQVLRLINSPSLTNAMQVKEWLKWGADETLILAVVADTMQDLASKSKPPPSMLCFFDKAIKKALAVRSQSYVAPPALQQKPRYEEKRTGVVMAKRRPD